MKLHDNLFFKLLNMALTDGGASLDILTAEPIKKNSGYMVGIKDVLILKGHHMKKHTDGQLESRFMMGLDGFELNLDNIYAGSWSDNGLIYFDISVWVNDRAFAVKLGRMFKQIAIYDIKNDASINLSEDGDKRLCEHCGSEVHQGHYMFEQFYLCTECFEKFYDGNMAEYMYDNELQFYTEWEEGE